MIASKSLSNQFFWLIIMREYRLKSYDLRLFRHPRVNCRSFLDFGTATHSFTFTALKSDLLKVSKSTIFCQTTARSLPWKNRSFLRGCSFSATDAVQLPSTVLHCLLRSLQHPVTSLSGTGAHHGSPALSVSSITRRSIPYPIPPVGGIPISSAFRKSSSVCCASSSPASNAFLSCCCETFSLINRVIQLGICITHLPSIDTYSSKRSTLFGIVPVSSLVSGEIVDWMIHNKCWLNQLLFTDTLQRTGSGCHPSYDVLHIQYMMLIC